MIIAFMAMNTGGPIVASKLATGISHALCITLAGVGLAIPAIFFKRVFQEPYHSRVDGLRQHRRRPVDNRCTHNSKKAGTASGCEPAVPVCQQCGRYSGQTWVRDGRRKMDYD